MIQKLIQAACVRTQREPLLSLYRAHYRATVKALAGHLEKLPGFVAFYLIGSVTDEPLYGLSDIDLIVVTERSEDYAEVHRVHRKLNAAARVLAPAHEIGVYSVATLESAFRTYPFYQFRCSPGPSIELVCGRDVIRAFEPTFHKWQQIESRVFMLWDGLRHTLLEVAQDPGSSIVAVDSWLHQRFLSYYWHKIVADLVSFMHGVSQPGPLMSRSQVRSWLKTEAGRTQVSSLLPDERAVDEVIHIVSATGAQRTELALTPDQGLALFCQLLGAYFAARRIAVERALGPAGPASTTLTVHTAEPRARWIPAPYWARDARGFFTTDDGVDLPEHLSDPVRLMHLDRCLQLVRYDTLPSLTALQQLRREAERAGALDLIVVCAGVGLSLLCPSSPWAVVHADTHPELFAPASQDTPHTWRVDLPAGRAHEIEEAYRCKQEMLRRISAEEDDALSRHAAQDLLWHSMEAWYALVSSDDRSLHLCTSRSQLASTAAERGVISPAMARRLTSAPDDLTHQELVAARRRLLALGAAGDLAVAD